MLIIRLARRGRSNAPFYDIVLAEKSRPVKKKFITKLGYFNPLADKGAGELVYDKDLAKKYISNGAQLSQAVARLLTKDGLKEAGKFIEARTTKPKKEAPAPEPKEEAAPAAEEAPAEETAVEEAPATEETPADESGEADAETEKSE